MGQVGLVGEGSMIPRRQTVSRSTTRRPLHWHYPNLEKFAELTWARWILTTVRQWIRRLVHQTTFLQISGDLVPTHLTPIELIFLCFLEKFWTRTLLYALANTSKDK